MKKILSIVVALTMAMVLAISASAATLFELTEVARNDTPAGANIVFADGVVWNEMGEWYPAAITQYMSAAVAADFVAAIQVEGAQIRIAYTGDASVNILLQAYTDYAWTNTEGSDAKVAETEEDGMKVVYFDAAKFVKLYTDAGLSLDDVLNFSISASGCTLYSVSVVDGAPAAEAPAEEPAEDTPVENTEEAPAEAEETPAETGLAFAVIPAIVAMAAVVISKKR